MRPRRLSARQTGIPASPATGARSHHFAEVRDALKAISGTARNRFRQEPDILAEWRIHHTDPDCSDMSELSHWPTCRPVGKP